MSKLQPVRGTKDILSDDYRIHQHIINVAGKVGELYGFEGFSTPVFEFTEVFKRTLGDTSDVVNKEMYTFEDKGGESITLRPEFTAGIARAVISNGLQQSLPLKLFSHGPLFRYERPQKGRQRQFHQINFEWLGDAGALADAEIISLASEILKKTGVKNYTLEINTLGDSESRANYRAMLQSYFAKHKEQLSADSKERIEKGNPLRVLDSKDEEDKKITKDAPKVIESLNQKSKELFDSVLSGLDSMGISYNINPHIVRGLDYYNDVVFEFVSHADEAGAQNTILAGGRYDNLIFNMGGPKVPAVGFAAGIERLALLSDVKPENNKLVAVISEKDNKESVRVAANLRNNGFATEIFSEGKFDKRMKKANKAGADVIVVIKEDGSFDIKSNSDVGKNKAQKIEEVLK